MSFFDKFRAFRVRGRRGRGQLVWIDPHVDDRAMPWLEKDVAETRAKTEAAMDKFAETLKSALWGNYDYPDKLDHLTRGLEQLRIDMLNFERVREKTAA